MSTIATMCNFSNEVIFCAHSIKNKTECQVRIYEYAIKIIELFVGTVSRNFINEVPANGILYFIFLLD